MSWWHEAKYLLRKLDRRRADAELDEEIRAHIEMEVDRNLERGMTADEARRAAMRAFGNVTLVKEDTRTVWGFSWLETFWRDVRYGARLLAKTPVFTVVAVVTLAIGIGATTAIFSVVDSVLLRELPFGEPERIVTLWETNLKDGIERDDVSPANFLDWRERATLFEEMAFANPYGFDYMGGGEPETWDAALVSDGFFQVLGVGALHGRTFLPEEYAPGGEPVAVLSHGLWRDRFGGDPSLVGQKILLDGEPVTVVGIMPPEFELNLFEREKRLWLPQAPDEAFRQQRRATYLKVVAKLAPGATIEAARAEMDAIASQLATEHPQTNAGVGVTTVSLPEQMTGKARPALVVLFGAVCLVLLVACANVANLMLARSSRREREIALRAAIGASRSRLVRQMLVESLLLALTGCVAGVALAWAAIRAILALSPDDIPRLDQASLDPVALAFAVGVSFLTVVLFGLAPAMQFSKPNLQEALKEAGHTTAGSLPRSRLRSALVVSEIALALVLLVGAGLLGRSFTSLLEVDPGFAADRLVALQVFIWDRYPKPEQRALYVEQALARLETVPGVEAAAVTTALPFLESSMDTSYPFVVEGRPAPPPGTEPTAFATTATSDYFEVLGVPLLAGRGFDARDTAESTPVVVVNESFARRHFPSESPVGRRISVTRGSRNSRGPLTYEIVGVVGDVRNDGLDRAPRVEYYRPHAQASTGSLIFAVRTSADPAALLPVLKSRIWEVNPTQPFYSTPVVGDLVSQSLSSRRFSFALVGLFAGVALVLAVVGIYGVMSFVTSHRTHEIGVRMALGASNLDIVRLVIGEGARLTLIGVVLGLAGAFVVTRYLTSMLFGVEPYDAWTFAAVSLALVAAALLACYLPARRATRLNPTLALRCE